MQMQMKLSEQMQMKLSEQMQIRLYKMASGYIIDFSNIYDQVRSDW